jgi:hypothetical protein
MTGPPENRNGTDHTDLAEKFCANSLVLHHPPAVHQCRQRKFFGGENFVMQPSGRRASGVKFIG